MTKEIQCWDSKDTLTHINQEAIIAQSLQDLLKVSRVLFPIAAGNEQVINVIVAEGKATQDFINKPLKCLRSISEVKWHPEELK